MRLQYLWRLTRPFSLTASIVPVMVGAAAVSLHARLSALPIALVLLVTLLLQGATNMWNEYYDHRDGIDDTASVGIAGLLVHHITTPRAVRHAALGTYAAALGAGLLLAVLRGLILLPVGILAMAIGYLYSAGPRPLSRTPWGEGTVFLAMGPLAVAVGAFAAGGVVTAATLASSLTVGCTVAAILLGNNLRDAQRDVRAGRTTLAAYTGRAQGARLLLMLLVVGACLPLAFGLVGLLPLSAALPVIALPAIWHWWRRQGRGMATGHRATPGNMVPALARIHLYIGVMLTAGLVAGRWV